MHINIKEIKKSKYSILDVANLALIRQIRYCDEDDIDYIVSSFSRTPEFYNYRKDGIVTRIKGNKSQKEDLKLRLTPKGLSLLNKLTEVGKGDVELYNKISNLYKKYECHDRIKERASVPKHITAFMEKTGYSREHVLSAVDNYLNNTERKLVLGLNNLIYRNPTVFKSTFDLDHSPLYYYIKTNLVSDDKTVDCKS